MLEKPNRKKIDKQDGNTPTNIEQLIQRYDLEKVWPYIEKIIDNLNEIELEKLIEVLNVLNIKDGKLQVNDQEILEYEVVDTW